jgi:tetratricopeptide (TPR) repeat protein
MSTHLVKHQKITKRQIKEDPLVTAAFRATEVWEQHGTRILIGVGAVVVVGLLAFFMAQARDRAEQKASGDLMRASMAVSQGDYASAAPMLREIVDNAQGTDASRTAMLYLGDSFLAQKRASEAVEWYQKYLSRAGGDRDRQWIGHLALATAYEDQGKFAEAAASYAEARNHAATDNDRGRAMLAEGRCYLRAGKAEKALETYKAILVLPQATQEIADPARIRIGEIQATSAAN